MLLRATLFLAAVANAVSRPSFHKPINDIPATSALGNKILSRARRLDQEDDITWVAGYSIKFQSCHSIDKYAAEVEGGEENDIHVYAQRLVKFQLCPSGTCSSASSESCSDGAEYVVDMAIFVDAYTEAKMEAEEYACEMVRENCYCQDVDDDEACENQCYRKENMEYCIENDNENGEEFEVQRYLECAEAEFQNDDDGSQYFIGPYCSSGHSGIYLGVFTDETCSVPGDDDMYGYYNYGYTLPYSLESADSLVAFDCIECKEPDDENDDNNNNNNNNNQEDVALIQMCEELYEQAAKCESNLDIDNPKTSGCTFIQDTIYRIDNETQASTKKSPAVAFAWIFGISTVFLCAATYYLYSKLDKRSVNLSELAGGTMA